MNLDETAKSDFYKNEIEKSENDYEKVWRVVNQASDSTYSKTENIKVANTQGLVLTENKDVADCFNNFFSNVGAEMDGKIELCDRKLPQKRNRYSIFLNPVTKKKVISIITCLKSGSSLGSDNIFARLIKICHTQKDPSKYRQITLLVNS
ncbi:hypothetical protein HHI36_007781 [Cryptolaemus montrouzieri]|uniref:Uncharacterized protein n=1 Tax=Cryptolaemus montrouzieri TaxID=559131 RepID=A0ABD2MQP7_9CUCU